MSKKWCKLGKVKKKTCALSVGDIFTISSCLSVIFRTIVQNWFLDLVR